MRAAVLTTPNTALGIEDLEQPRPKYGEVLVDVTTCGVCHTDLHVMKAEVGFPTPAVLGHEVSGTITEIGQGVTDLHVGQRVVASFIMPCGSCRHCVRGHDDLCSTFFAHNRLNGTLYDGTSRLRRADGTPVAMYSMGGLAEQCVVPATDVFPIPDELELGDVATLGCSALTAYGAVRNVADLRPGDTVAVVAVGGVGSAIIQLAAAFGAREIIAIDVSDEKLAAATLLGATATINSSVADPTQAVSELTSGRGVDVAFEALGRAETFQTACAVVGDGGSAVVVGIGAAGTQGQVDLTRLPRRKLRILGSYGGRPRTDMPVLIDLVARGALMPQAIISRRYSLDQVNEAYGALDRGEIIGRAVVDLS